MVLTEESAKREKNDNHSNKNADKREKPLTKVVIRRLPPSMTQEEFLNQVSPIPNYNYIYTIKGDNSLGGNAFARVYVNFTNAEDIYIFKEKFDNYVFIDGNGHEYAAVVEYASFQKVPKRRKPRADLKAGTIDSDPAYISFLETLNEQPNQEEKPEYNLNLTSTDNKNDITTPLLDYLKQRKVERMRMREEKREERRKKEQEKKKIREEDRKKRLEEKKQKSIAVKEGKKDQKERPIEVEVKTDDLVFKDTDEPEETKPIPERKPEKTSNEKEKPDRERLKAEKAFKNRAKYEEKKQQKKFKFEERKDMKNRRDESFRDRNREHQLEKKFEPKPEMQKKIKKYSERREERKNVEASKEEAKRAEFSKKDTDKTPESTKVPEVEKPKKTCSETANVRSEDGEHFGKKNKENDPRTQRRIRNKDRPAMQIYKPGMLRKKSVDNDKEVVVVEEKGEVKEKPPVTEE